MAHTEPDLPNSTFISLGAEHAEAAFLLSSGSGWNQTVDDWLMMLGQGTGIGIIDGENQLVASAICLPYGTEFGWISMVLVHPSWRKKGLATKLLHRCIDVLEDQALMPILDATPEGEGVYRPLGFISHFGLTRWQSDAPMRGAETNATRALLPDDLSAVKALDRQVFGGSREIILETLQARSPQMCRCMKDGSGFVLARNGRTASQIGPLVATSEQAAIDLLNDALNAAEGAVFVDAADHKPAVSEFLLNRGFVVQRPFLRMAKGRVKPLGMPENLYAVAGPELG